ncbi:MAG: hypothetical protein HN919_17090 [Verrucomicrobia bacterium]|nr:hypothetical protein [Verrucomicrobiota bacterium]
MKKLMIRTLLCALVVGAITCSCVSSQNDMLEPTPTIVAPDKTAAPITSDAQAKVRALLFAKQRQLDWGQPTGLYRTVSKWYAVEFQDGDQKQKRIVLVNPENGHAELPMRR